MLRNTTFAISFVTLFLLVYIVFLQLPGFYTAAVYMLLASPFLIVWMVYTVIRYGTYTGTELGEGEEFGYEDMKKEDLGVF